jgi:hypothetical protein
VAARPGKKPAATICGRRSKCRSARQTGDWRCPSIAHRPDRGDRGCPRRRRPEPNAGVRTPELCPYRLNNRLVGVIVCTSLGAQPLCNTVARVSNVERETQRAARVHGIRCYVRSTLTRPRNRLATFRPYKLIKTQGNVTAGRTSLLGFVIFNQPMGTLTPRGRC